jgi:hypothetical protein
MCFLLFVRKLSCHFVIGCCKIPTSILANKIMSPVIVTKLTKLGGHIATQIARTAKNDDIEVHDAVVLHCGAPHRSHKLSGQPAKTLEPSLHNHHSIRHNFIHFCVCTWPLRRSLLFTAPKFEFAFH